MNVSTLNGNGRLVHVTCVQAVATKVNTIKEGSKVLQLLKPPSDDNKNNHNDDDASPDINDVQDIDSYDAVAGMCKIHKYFEYTCLNKPNVAYAPTSLQQTLLIVQTAQKLSGIVVITGDGVNDSRTLNLILVKRSCKYDINDKLASITHYYGVEEVWIEYENSKKSLGVQ